MGEPLFDGIAAAVVSFGVAAVLALRSAAAEVSDARRAFRLGVAGHLLLGVAASLLMYRWISGVTSLPSETRPNVWSSVGLVFACGMGLVAAVKAVIGPTIVRRAIYFATTVGFAEVALLLAGEWRWALLLQVLLFGVIALAKWFVPRVAREDKDAECDGRREPVLVVLVSSALLLLFLGTWQHVIEHEARRTTRSTRYSAWPRATALKDAWERTGWVAKPDDHASAARVTDLASREQRIALGLGALLLVVVTASLRRPSRGTTTAEANHAG